MGVCVTCVCGLCVPVLISMLCHAPVAIPPRPPTGLSIEQQEEVDAPQIDGADKCIMHTYTHRKFVVSLCVCVCGLFGQNNKLICKQPQQSQPSEILPFRHCSRNFVVFFFPSALVGGLRVCV